MQSYYYNNSREDFPKRLERNEIYASEWMNLYSDKVKMPNGCIVDTYHKLHVSRESVCIEDGECAETAARRECMEETGCDIKELKYMCSQNPSNGISDVLIHFYIAKVDRESNIFDGNEVERKQWISKNEISTILQNNQTKCGVSMFALLFAKQFYL